jgi:hypothetical protein
MEMLLSPLAATYGPAALVTAVFVLKWLGGAVLSRLSPAPTPVPGLPGTPLIAPTTTPTLLGVIQAWAKAAGHPIPDSLVRVSADVLTAIRADLDRVHPAPK